MMKNLIIVVAVAASLLVSYPIAASPIWQKTTDNKARNLKVDVRYDKKTDITRVRLDEFWLSDPVGHPERFAMDVSFEYPKRAVVKPSEVKLRFSSTSTGWDPFPVSEVFGLVDGERLELGEVKGGQTLIRSGPGGVEFDRRDLMISFDKFARLAQAKELTMIVGDRKYKIKPEHLQALHDFYELMQMEGRKLG